MVRKLIIFAKYPIPGNVKTRLTPHFSPHKACEIYKKLAAYTFGLSQELALEEKIQIEVAFSGGSLEEIKQFVDHPFSFHEQQGEGLGDKMTHSLKKSLIPNQSQIVIIGTDCPEIKKTHLKTAFNQLLKSNVTIGPSIDGGYYLIGFNGDFSDIFQKIPWSTGKVFSKTIQACKKANISHSLLPTLHDLDTKEDFDKLSPNYPWLAL